MKLKVTKEFKDKNNDEVLRKINTCFEENDKKRAWFLINGEYCIEVINKKDFEELESL